MSHIYSPETVQRLNNLRQKLGENTATQEELQEAVRLMRQDRRSAATANAASKSSSGKAKQPKAVVNPDDMLDELGKM